MSKIVVLFKIQRRIAFDLQANKYNVCQKVVCNTTLHILKLSLKFTKKLPKNSF
jgi:hypothetical protein